MSKNNEKPKKDWSKFTHKRSIYGQWHRYYDTNYEDMKEEISAVPARRVEQYEKDLMIRKVDLAGKDVLDLGAGPTAQLERDLKGFANVVSLRPDYSETDLRNSLCGLQTVNALGQDIPFPNAFFDCVLIENVFQHCNFVDFIDLLKEAIRVTKPGGQVISGQVIFSKLPYDRDLYRRMSYRRLSISEMIRTRMLEGLKIGGVNTNRIKIIAEEIESKHHVRDQGRNFYHSIFCIKILKR
jgi:ubiquinone/menaquinone biosynthesis C-methylase UbiE